MKHKPEDNGLLETEGKRVGERTNERTTRKQNATGPVYRMGEGQGRNFNPKSVGYNFPSPSLPISSLSLPSLHLPSPLEVGPLIELEGLGECCKLPIGVRGVAPAAHACLRNFSSKDGGLL